VTRGRKTREGVGNYRPPKIISGCKDGRRRSINLTVGKERKEKREVEHERLTEGKVFGQTTQQRVVSGRGRKANVWGCRNTKTGGKHQRATSAPTPRKKRSGTPTTVIGPDEKIQAGKRG